VQASAAWRLQVDTVRSIISSATEYGYTCDTETTNNGNFKNQVKELQSSYAIIKQKSSASSADLEKQMEIVRQQDLKIVGLKFLSASAEDVAIAEVKLAADQREAAVKQSQADVLSAELAENKVMLNTARVNEV